MTIDYNQLKILVKEAMFTGGGINEPSAPVGVPHRMPSADTWDQEQNMGEPKANELYELALVAREATEVLVEALDEPIFDDAYEHAFKASANLRRALNSLEQTGAHPMPWQRVVPPSAKLQKYAGTVGYQGALTYGANGAASTMIEATTEADEGEREQPSVAGFGVGGASKNKQARASTEKSKGITAGDVNKDVDPGERKIIMQVDKILTQIADYGDLKLLKPALKAFLTQFIKKAEAQDKTELENPNENHPKST